MISGEGDGAEFFARNYVTQGMDTLLREGLPKQIGLFCSMYEDAIPISWRGMIHKVIYTLQIDTV